MRDSERLALEITRVVHGDPWFGSPASALLADVDELAASTVPTGANHSIWELVLHMTSWADHVAYRLAGGPPSEPARGDWPALPAVDAASWAAAIADCRRAHEELAAIVRAIPDAELDEGLVGATIGEDGTPSATKHYVAAGVAQHSAYHCGQIAVVKRWLTADTGSRP